MNVPVPRLRLPGIAIAALLASILLSPFSALHAEPLQTVDLSGTWNFTPVGGSATTIQVPGGGWYKQGYTSISQADYSRSITIPNIVQPQVTILEFGAVNYQADLYVNEVFVGSRIQSWTPATFDITNYVTPGNTYTIRVRVKGRNAFMVNGKSLVPNAAGWSANTPQGIFRSAKLLAYPQIYISDVFVRPSVADTSLSYDVWLRNASGSTANVTLSGLLSSWNGDSWSYPSIPPQDVTIAANTTIKVTVGPVNWNLGSASYWWPNVPYQPGYTAKLHLLALAISGDGSDLTSVRFGFRECKQQPDGLGNTIYTLNGIRVNFRGDSFQGANYDAITYGGGKSDAYDTFPGFLPGPNGWPRAVDNFQRLNYNVVRIHQEPATPYMLEVCDEMGLMIIEETAIRGSGNDQNFLTGHDNMVNHLKALFTRDRNHASIVRQSISNEPNWSSTDSTQFEVDLYDAAMSVDGTRPLSIDSGGGPYGYESMNYSNFSVYGHYASGLGNYTDEAWPRADRPYGQGEFVWYVDNTAQGFAWFATGTQGMRARGASDVRPYTLLSAWASLVPGVNTYDMWLEQGGYPLYGENNLPDPWANPIIQRVQAGFHPLLVADGAYWGANALSNSAGEWPVNFPALAPNEHVTRTLTVYNDTFSGTAIDVNWEFRQDSPTGQVVASGLIEATVPLGYTTSHDISFTTPAAPNGTTFYLVLYAQKNGVEVFRESSERFVIDGGKLAGEPFGTSPPWLAGREFDKASDGNVSTYFDYLYGDGGYTGIDLGEGNAKIIRKIVFTPRSGYESRMVGGVFEGSNDNVNYTTLYAVPSTPYGSNTVSVDSSDAFRYLRYRGPNGSYGNIAEMAFYASSDANLSGLAPSAGTLAPAFDSATTNYGATVPYTTSVLTVTPTVADSGATVKVDGVTVTSGSASQPISLGVGSNIVTTEVTAADGVTTKTYSLDVTRLSGIQTWRQTWYGTTSNSGNASDSADPYGTGVKNLSVFGLLGPNQDPATAKQSQLPQAEVVGDNFVLMFTDPEGAAGVTFGAESSDTLADGGWQPVADTGNGPNHVFSVPIGSKKKVFMRLIVTNTLD